ncbi:MAG TPA: Asp-tRNA(Asn)/Glu-tRNA(Gln) amidotransferase subunit GatC [Polyangiaceae bacterium]|nr:Asp-tRNA(Asn)/Glu-tRNA(Gln) amidotransferase subunit GatC [Polyangiaceae bacterium]
MALSPADVLYIAQLADLELTPEEVTLLSRDLGAVLEHIGQLSELDTRDVPPMTHLGVAAMPLRPDVVVPGLAQEAAVAEAPRVNSGAFAVPKFVDE